MIKVDYPRDWGHFAHADARGALQLTETLCAFRAGNWCVLAPALPQPERPEPPWSITHAPSGQRLAIRTDLWRAILLCEECDKAFGLIDPREASPGENAELHQRAAAAACLRERAVVDRVFTRREVLVDESGEFEVSE